LKPSIDDLEREAKGIGRIGVQIERLARENETRVEKDFFGPNLSLVIGDKGRVGVHDSRGPAIGHSFATVQDLFQYVAERADSKKAALFLSSVQLVCILDCEPGAQRRDRVTCTLIPTTAWASITQGPLSFTQEQLIERCRNEWRSQDSCRALLPLIRNLKWTKLEESDGGVATMKSTSSYSKAVELKAAGGIELPEELLIEGEIFSNLGGALDEQGDFVFKIPVVVTVDFRDQKIRLTPDVEAIRDRMIGALRTIAGFRTENDPPIYLGTP
jgi:hypothetical protein